MRPPSPRPSSKLDIGTSGTGRSGVLPARGNTVAIVPCLNEARAVGGVVLALQPFVRETLVIDDGSTDGTASVASAAGATVCRLESSLGKGAALAVGWTAAANHGAEWVLLLDGDGQHDPLDAPGLFSAATEGVRLVVGNRMPQAAAMPWLRRQTNRWMSRRISALAGIPIPDSQCGFRLAHLASLQQAGLHSRQFEIESEMLVAFARAGWGVAFAPVQVRYRDERSKISPLRDTLRWIRWYRSTAAATRPSEG